MPKGMAPGTVLALSSPLLENGRVPQSQAMFLIYSFTVKGFDKSYFAYKYKAKLQI